MYKTNTNASTILENIEGVTDGIPVHHLASSDDNKWRNYMDYRPSPIGFLASMEVSLQTLCLSSFSMEPYMNYICWMIHPTNVTDSGLRKGRNREIYDIG